MLLLLLLLAAAQQAPAAPARTDFPTDLHYRTSIVLRSEHGIAAGEARQQPQTVAAAVFVTIERLKRHYNSSSAIS